MSLSQNYIRCYFDFENKSFTNIDGLSVEIFYAKTNDLFSAYNRLKTSLSIEELKRAERFHFDKDRHTYVSCHALLRSILSKKLEVKSDEIIFNVNLHNKPGLVGYHPYSFNITHTRDAFAIAISNSPYIGIDLERVNRDFNFNSIIKNFFSKGENVYILDSEEESLNRFLLLWTRKEALLKAFSVGIVTDLTKVEVYQQDNYIEKSLLGDQEYTGLNYENFIYSTKVSDHYLSVAVPQKAEIVFYQINEKNLSIYTD